MSKKQVKVETVNTSRRHNKARGRRTVDPNVAASHPKWDHVVDGSGNVIHGIIVSKPGTGNQAHKLHFRACRWRSAKNALKSTPPARTLADQLRNLI